MSVSTGLPTVPYLTVQYRILTLVPFVPYSTENVPFFEYISILKFVAKIHGIASMIPENCQISKTFPAKFSLN